MIQVLDGLRAGKKPREMAVDIFGADRVAEDWYPDGGMRSQMRRWIAKAEALSEGGWRELVPRYVADE